MMPNKIKKFELIGLSPNSNKLKEYKNPLIQLTKVQLESSIGLVLGDASLQTQNKGKTYRMKFEWGNKNVGYAKHVYSLFDEWVISEPHKKVRFSPKGNKVTNWGFQTLSHSAFNILADLFIIDGQKSIPNNLITNHLTPIGLAYWFMDDGGKLDYNPNSNNKNIVLNTQSFKNSEVIAMCDQLNDKFNLDCEIRSNKGRKIIVIKNYSVFISLTDPHIISEMKYKLP